MKMQTSNTEEAAGMAEGDTASGGVDKKMQKVEGGGKRASIGVNLRVTGHCQQGGRKYMEDYFAVAYQQTDDEKDLEYAFFGIFDGHGGAEAAAFAKEHLMQFIVKDPRFWFEEDEEVLAAIEDGFIDTHHAMWKIHDKWPRTASGLPSTAGTTASIAFIRRGKIYFGHVGDSGISLGYQNPGCTDWQAKSLTKDHKPECSHELERIEQAGGKVALKMGVARVVWNRPRVGHKGPVRRSTPIDEIPFLAVARSLGDLWSYNPNNGEFVVSPKPDVGVHVIDTSTFRCLIFGTDGLYNMLSPHMAVHIVQEAERRNEEATLYSPNPHWINPSKTLVERALDRWCNTKMRADNTSVITIMLDPPGPPRAQVLRTQRLEREKERLKMIGVVEPIVQSGASDAIVEVKDNKVEVTKDYLEAGVPKLKPRESIAFDPYASTSPSNVSTKTHKTPQSLTPQSTEIPKVSENPTNTTHSSSSLTSLPSLACVTSETPNAATSSESASNQKASDDIQINEITSSSPEQFVDSKKKKSKKSVPPPTSAPTPTLRKFNLRSNQSINDTPVNHNLKTDKPKRGVTAGVKALKANKVDKATTQQGTTDQSLLVMSRRSMRTPLGENNTETTRLIGCSSGLSSGSGSSSSSGGGGESRVLRERRNTTPNMNSNVNTANSSIKSAKILEKEVAKMADKDKFKKKSIKKKMGLSTEKKKLLQNLLFKKAETTKTNAKQQKTHKTKENNAKTPPKPTSSSTTTPPAGRRSERKKPQQLNETPRAMRKSTLKLRIPEGLFKAKQRAQTAPAKIKLKKKPKGLSLKNYAGS